MRTENLSSNSLSSSAIKLISSAVLGTAIVLLGLFLATEYVSVYRTLEKDSLKLAQSYAGVVETVLDAGQLSALESATQPFTILEEMVGARVLDNELSLLHSQGETSQLKGSTDDLVYRYDAPDGATHFSFTLPVPLTASFARRTASRLRPGCHL